MNSTTTIDAPTQGSALPRHLRERRDVRRATHGFNLYLHPALVQVHINDEDEAEGVRLATLLEAAGGLLDACKIAFAYVEAQEATPRNRETYLTLSVAIERAEGKQ